MIIKALRVALLFGLPAFFLWLAVGDQFLVFGWITFLLSPLIWCLALVDLTFTAPMWFVPIILVSLLPSLLIRRFLKSKMPKPFCWSVIFVVFHLSAFCLAYFSVPYFIANAAKQLPGEIIYIRIDPIMSMLCAHDNGYIKAHALAETSKGCYAWSFRGNSFERIDNKKSNQSAFCKVHRP